MLTTANPAVRVAADWNKPSRKRKAGGRTVTVESLSCARLVKVVDWSADCAYIENDEKDQIYAVQANKFLNSNLKPKQPTHLPRR